MSDEELDRLTQLQQCLDQLVIQFYSALGHVNTHHDFMPLTPNDTKVTDNTVTPVTQQELESNMKELAKDVVLKTQQVENLIDSLPGLQSSEADQIEKLKKLEQELQDAEKERQQVLTEKENLLDQCDELILQVSRDKVEIDRDPVL